MYGLVLASHVAALCIFGWFIVYYEVPLNARMIIEDGSQDSLKAGFHARRTWVRLWWWLAVCAGGSVAAAFISWPVAFMSFGMLGVLLDAVFLRTFNPLLNAALKLDYKRRFYASPVSVSFPDKQVWAYVRKQHPDVPDSELQATANSINQLFLNAALTAGLLFYVGVWACLLLKR
jgi:hypothetical protein